MLAHVLFILREYRVRKRNDGFEMVPRREQSAALELGTPHEPIDGNTIIQTHQN